MSEIRYGGAWLGLLHVVSRSSNLYLEVTPHGPEECAAIVWRRDDDAGLVHSQVAHAEGPNDWVAESLKTAVTGGF